MEENIEKIREYAKYSFGEAEKVKQYTNVDIKSYQIDISLIILVSIFICLIFKLEK
jgi:hypothetical protein